MEDDEDPVIAEYDVYITPEVHDQIYVLQYLNRTAAAGGFTRKNKCEPTQVRIKEQSGFVEVDVPVDIHQNFSRTAGVRWGEALRKTKGFGQKAYGISSGFERVMPRPARPGTNGTPAPVAIEDDDNLEEWVINFEDANEKGHVLNTQTFGGQIAKDDGKGPSYMLGSFEKGELHLTRAHGLVQMRTQFHHLDAITQLEVVNRRREKESQEGAKAAEPKAFLPTVKKAGGDTAVEITQAFMKATSQERWKKLRYNDEDSESAWAAYKDDFFVENRGEAPKLRASMTNAQYLDAISAPSSGKGKKRPATKRAEDPIEISDESDEEEEGPKASESNGDVQMTNEGESI